MAYKQTLKRLFLQIAKREVKSARTVLNELWEADCSNIQKIDIYSIQYLYLCNIFLCIQFNFYIYGIFFKSI